MKVTDDVVLKELAEDFISIMENGNEENFASLWHPKAIRFGIGNSLELMTMNKDEMIKFSIQGLKNLKKQLPNPELIEFQIEEIIQIKCIEGVLGLVEMKWHMILPGSKGTHHTFIQFAKHEGKWVIVNILDKGFEIEE